MGGKNSVFPTFGGCQAVSEIKQAGSSNGTSVLVLRQVLSECSTWIYTLTHSGMCTHSHLFLTWLCTRHFFLRRTCYKITNLRNQHFSEHIQRFSNYTRWKRESLEASSTKNKSAFLFGVSKDDFWGRVTVPLTGVQKLFKAVQSTFPVLSSFIFCHKFIWKFPYYSFPGTSWTRMPWAFAQIHFIWTGFSQLPSPSQPSSGTRCSRDVTLLPLSYSLIF